MNTVFVLLIAFLAVAAVITSANEASSIPSVSERGLVVEEIDISSIIAEHGRVGDSYSRTLPPDTISLGYVTPWNGKGYEYTLSHGSSLTHVSPVWYNVAMKRPDAKRKNFIVVEISGEHDQNQKWLAEMKEKQPHVRIVPRFKFVFSVEDYRKLTSSLSLQTDISNKIASVVSGIEGHGAVLEMSEAWAVLSRARYEKRRTKLNKFVGVLSTVLSEAKAGNQLFLAVYPPSTESNGLFTVKDIIETAPHVAGFSIMTYDYTRMAKPGPSSPFKWMKEAVKKFRRNLPDSDHGKILIGLNFYGMLFVDKRAEAITGEEFIKEISAGGVTSTWDRSHREHTFLVQSFNAVGVMSKQSIAFPTLQSINDRVEYAKQIGVGIAIWELGQGLEYFFELL